MAFRSLTTRLIFWTLLASGGVLLATLAASDRVARETALQAAELEARQAADRVANRVRTVLAAVTESAELLAAAIETTHPDKNGVERLLQRFVSSEDDVAAAAAAYAPEALPARGLFAPFVLRGEEPTSALRVLDLATRGDYTRYAWYTAVARSRQPEWSEPDKDPVTGVMRVTYAVPFFDAGQPDSTAAAGGPTLRGVAAADVRLEFVARIVREVHPGQTGRALVLSRGGRILALSADRRLAGTAPALEQLPAERRAALAPLLRHMRSGDTGFAALELDGRRQRVVFQPIGIAGWSLAVSYPEQELMAGARRLRLLQATFGLLGLAVLGAVVTALSRRLTAPLRELSRAALGLGANLEAPLPPTRSQDELGSLAAALREMREALRREVHALAVTTKAKQRLESELAIARRIQREMLPPERAGGPGEGYALAALLEPASAVAGDLFDHLRNEDRLVFLVADVSGKGVPAALFMVRTKTLFEVASARFRAPDRILAEVNRGLVRENEAGMYVTAVCGVLELRTGALSLAVAGHAPPLTVSDGRPARPLEVEGSTVLGLFENAAFAANGLRLAAGETLVVFTDGIDEAFDAQEQAFGRERLLACLEGAGTLEVERIPTRVREAVREFVGAAPQSDDITVLALRWLGR